VDNLSKTPHTNFNQNRSSIVEVITKKFGVLCPTGVNSQQYEKCMNRCAVVPLRQRWSWWTRWCPLVDAWFPAACQRSEHVGHAVAPNASDPPRAPTAVEDEMLSQLMTDVGCQTDDYQSHTTTTIG